MRDADNDGYGDASAVLPVVAGTDCADTDPSRHPGATETCGDGIDSNCDGSDPVCPIAHPRRPLAAKQSPRPVLPSKVDH
jgi:hypothetical protein